MNQKRKKPLPERKVKIAKELKELIEKKRTILLASIKNIPAFQFQKIVKKLRGKAIVKVPKKRIAFKAIDECDEEEIKKLKKQMNEGFALLFSDLDGFELALELLKSKTPVKAKAGQVAPEDIIVEAGPTNLPPGPAISELGAVGLQVQIEKGKITIKEPKTIVKKGETISQAAAEVMAKLDIKPFQIGFVPLAIFDNKEKKLYLNIELDVEKTIGELKKEYGKALAFAVEIEYATKESIGFLLAKAEAHARAIEKISKEKRNESREKTEEQPNESGSPEQTSELNPKEEKK